MKEYKNEEIENMKEIFKDFIVEAENFIEKRKEAENVTSRKSNI